MMHVMTVMMHPDISRARTAASSAPLMPVTFDTLQSAASRKNPLECCAFGLLQMKTSRTFIRDATAASPLALALFGAGTLDVAHEGGYVALGGWLRFRAPAQVARLAFEGTGTAQCLELKR
jgi:hypothetical protein